MTETERERLVREVALLIAAEHFYKVPSMPIASQLINEAQRPLPDAIPRSPVWVEFKWPESGVVDLQGYWRQVDQGAHGNNFYAPYL